MIVIFGVVVGGVEVVMILFFDVVIGLLKSDFFCCIVCNIGIIFVEELNIGCVNDLVGGFFYVEVFIKKLEDVGWVEFQVVEVVGGMVVVFIGDYVCIEFDKFNIECVKCFVICKQLIMVVSEFLLFDVKFVEIKLYLVVLVCEGLEWYCDVEVFEVFVDCFVICFECLKVFLVCLGICCDFGLCEGFFVLVWYIVGMEIFECEGGIIEEVVKVFKEFGVDIVDLCLNVKIYVV